MRFWPNLQRPRSLRRRADVQGITDQSPWWRLRPSRASPDCQLFLTVRCNFTVARARRCGHRFEATRASIPAMKEESPLIAPPALRGHGGVPQSKPDSEHNHLENENQQGGQGWSRRRDGNDAGPGRDEAHGGRPRLGRG